MDTNFEKNTCGVLGDLFQHVVNDMKRMMPMWEEFLVKTSKLSVSLRSTVSSLSSFLDTLQKIADIATGARGATKEIGSGLTRLCLRHRNIENKLRAYSGGLLDAMVMPIQEKLEEWKKSLMLLDKEHSRDHKKTKQEIRKMSSDVMALQNKIRKGKPEVKVQLSDAIRDIKNKTYHFEEFEKSAVRTALVEERTRFCVFISCLKPVMDMEISLLTELTHIQEVVDSLCMQASDPSSLPAATEQIIADLQETKTDWFCQTPPILSKHPSFQSISSSCSTPSNDSLPRRTSTNDVGEKMPQNKWMPMRQRSWTGLAQFQSGRDLAPNSTHARAGSIRVPGRKKYPDINMIEDLHFRSSVHTHSLPPTPNPYAVPSVVDIMEGSSSDACGESEQDQQISKGVQPWKMTSNVDENLTGMWTIGSLACFENELPGVGIRQEQNQTTSDVANIGWEAKSSDTIDMEELAAAMQELEWTTAMLDNLNETSQGTKLSKSEENLDAQPTPMPSDCEFSASRNISKPPISGILRRGSVQGARKPPPPIRRTSSVTGSSIQITSGADDRLQSPAAFSVNTTREQPVGPTSTVAVAETRTETAFTKLLSSPPTLVFSQGYNDKDNHHGNGRKIPRVNRSTSQPYSKLTVSEEERLTTPTKERTRLPRRSLSETHAEIILTLTDQFSVKPSGVLSPSEKYPSRLVLGNGAGKVPVPSKSGILKSHETLLSQIPEGVTLCKGLSSTAGVQKNSPVQFVKKSS